MSVSTRIESKTKIPRSSLSAEDVITQVLAVSGGDHKELYTKAPGRACNTVRVVTAWWMIVGAGLSGIEVASKLKISPSSVTRAVRQVRSESIRKPDSDIVRWASALSEYPEN